VVALTEDLTKMKGVPPLPPDEEEKKWRAGDRCQALWSDDGKWYNARIESASELATYTVTYLDYGNTAEVGEGSLRPYVPAPVERLTEGTIVRVLWQGMFHPAMVQGLGSTHGYYKVKFARTKKKRDIPAYDIVLKEEKDGDEKGPGGSASAPPRKITSDKFEVPEHLIPKPSDSEKIRDQKKKKIKQLKSLHRKRKVEEERDDRKNSWLTFQKKSLGGDKKSTSSSSSSSHTSSHSSSGSSSSGGVVPGGGVKRLKRSIFASPDSVEGKVGVTGSGKPMTQEAKRDKHYFPEANEGKGEAKIPLPSDIV